MPKPKFDPNLDYSFEPQDEVTNEDVQQPQAEKPPFDPNAEYSFEPQQQEQPQLIDKDKEFKQFMNLTPEVIDWMDQEKKKNNFYPEIETYPYDFRRAVEEGSIPTRDDKGELKWPKLDLQGEPLYEKGHPEYWKAEYMAQTGEDPDETGISEHNARNILQFNGLEDIRDLHLEDELKAIKPDVGQVTEPTKPLTEEKQTPPDLQIDQEDIEKQAAQKLEGVETLEGLELTEPDEPVERQKRIDFARRKITDLSQKYDPKIQHEKDIAKYRKDNMIIQPIDNTMVNPIANEVELNQKQIKRRALSTNDKMDGEATYDAGIKLNLQRVLDDSHKLEKLAAQTGTKGEVAQSVLRGVGDYLSEYAKIAKNFEANKTMQSLQEKVDKYQKGEDVKFSQEEVDLFEALKANDELHKQLDNLIPTSVKVGESVGHSLGFAGEFALTAGIGKGLGMAIKGGAKFLSVKDIASKAIVSGVRAGAMPSFYKGIIDKVGQGDSYSKAIWDSHFDTATEVFTESFFLRNPYSKAASSNVARNAAERIGIALDDKKGFLGVSKAILEEYTEEKFGEAIRGAKSIAEGGSIDEVTNKFVDWEQNKLTFLTTAAMAGTMGTFAEGKRFTSDMMAKLGMLRASKRVSTDLKERIDYIVSNEDISQLEMAEAIENEVRNDVEAGLIDNQKGADALFDAIRYAGWKEREIAKEKAEIEQQLAAEKALEAEEEKSYRVGERIFAAKDKFLEAVKKLVGKKEDVDIEVKNDEETKTEADEILGIKKKEEEPTVEEEVDTEEIETNPPSKEFINTPVKYKDTTGKTHHGILKEDGQSLVVETPNRIFELGNKDELADVGIEDLNIKVEQPVEIDDAGNVNFRNKTYVNPNENKLDAVTFDDAGNIQSVELETEDGQQRIFRDQAAEDIAYQLYAQETFTDPEFNTFLDGKQDEIETGVRETTEEQAAQTDEGVPAEEKEKERVETDPQKIRERKSKEREEKIAAKAEKRKARKEAKKARKEGKPIPKTEPKKEIKPDETTKKKVAQQEKKKQKAQEDIENIEKLEQAKKEEEFIEGQVKESKEAEQEAALQEAIEEEEKHVTPEEVLDRIISKSKDKKEIATAFLSELEKPAGITGKENLISQYLGKISPESFKKFGDVNKLEGAKQIILNYFKDGAKTIDQVVEEINATPQGQKENITENDIVDFIEKFPSGIKTLPKEGGRSKELAQRYKEVTGEKKLLTKEKAEEIIKPKKDVEQDEAVVEELFGKVTEEKQDEEKEEKEERKEFRRFRDKRKKRRAEEPAPNYVSHETKKRVLKLITKLSKAFPEIEIYTNPKRYKQASEKYGETAPAFVADGKIYLDTSKVDEKAPLEEFAHIWLAIAKRKNKSVYNEGVRLVKNSPYMDQVKENPEYAGQVDTPDMLEEALAKAIADKGALLSNPRGLKGFVNKLSIATGAVTKRLGFSGRVKFFENTLEDFTGKVSKELLSEIPITNLTSAEIDNIENVGKTNPNFIARSLLDPNTLIDKKTRWAKRVLSNDSGAGRKLADIAKGVTHRMNAWSKEADFLVIDLNNQLKEFVKDVPKKGKEEKVNQVLEDIQRILTTKTEVPAKERIYKSDIPEALKETVYKIRKLTDRLTEQLQDDNVLVGEEIEAVLNENLGIYLHRSYAMHDVEGWAEKWADNMTEKQVADIYNFLYKRYGKSKVKRMDFEKLDDGISIKFYNSYGFESQGKIIDDFDALSPLFDDSDIDALKEQFKKENKGTYTLEYPTEEQNIDPILLTEEQIDDIIIPSILNKDGKPQIETGIKMDDMGFSAYELGATKKRKDIAEPIRMLMGEYTDPRVNFVKSITKMAFLLEKGKLWNMLEEAGADSFLTDHRTATNTEKLTYTPLNGKQKHRKQVRYTTPEIKELLEPSKLKTALDFQPLILLNGFAKATVTVGGLSSQTRNFFGAALNMIATGRLPLGLAKARRTAFADATAGEKAFQFMSTPIGVGALISTIFNKAGKAPSVEILRQLHLDAAKRGLLGQDVRMGVLNDLIEMATAANDQSTVTKLAKKLQNLTKNPSKVYGATDEIFKLSQFWAEIEDFKEIYPEKTEEEIKDIAAKKVRMMQPTYELAPKGVKLLSRSPAFGSFVMFVSETWRTRKNIIVEASKEIKEGIETNNAKLIRLGGQRLAGSAAMASAGAVLSKITAAMFGWSDDDEYQLGEIGPHYYKNTQRIYLNGNKKNPFFIPLTSFDPASVMYEPIIAAFKGEDPTDMFQILVGELVNPFINPEIGTQAMIEVLKNADQYNRAIVNQEWSTAEKLGTQARHILSTLIPAGARELYKVYLGFGEKETDFGRNFKAVTEMANIATGLKPKTYKSDLMFSFKMSDLNSKLENSRGIYSKSAAYQKKFDEDRFDEADRKARAVFNQMKKIYRGQIGLVGLQEANEALDKSYLAKYMKEMIKHGEYLGIAKEEVKRGKKVKIKKGTFIKPKQVKYLKQK